MYVVYACVCVGQKLIIGTFVYYSPPFYCCFVFVKSGSHYVALASLELIEVCLFLPPKWWD